MRYKCPARSSGRDVSNRTYQSPSPQNHLNRQQQLPYGQQQLPYGQPTATQRSVDSTVKQTIVPGWEDDYDRSSSPGGTHGSRQDTSVFSDERPPNSYQGQRMYNIIGDTQGVTNI